MSSQETELFVAGMTCGSCAAKVSGAVQSLSGVDTVRVDVSSGRLAVSGIVAEQDIRAAVSEAGYTVLDRRP